MTDCEAAVKVDEDGPFCVWLFFVFAGERRLPVAVKK
jgi:hypothetical protein